MACEFSVTLPGHTRGGVDAACAALDEVERLEAKLSVFREESELARLNRELSDRFTAVDPEVYRLLRWAARLSAATGGAFDPAGGALVRLWRGRQVPSDAAVTAALATSGAQHLEFDDQAAAIRASRPGIEFNLGAIGKGFAIGRGLHRMAVRCALMQGGQSSIKGTGSPAGSRRGWAVDLADPLRPGRSFARVWLRDRALGTSAADHQFFTEGGRRYGHILDPRTGRPARQVVSATAIAASATEADALSTAFFVMGVERTREFCEAHPEYGALLIQPPRVFRFGSMDAEVNI